MALASFICEHLEPIVEDWIRFARAIPAARRLPDTTLREHAAGILHTICAKLEHGQRARQQEQKGKGLAPRVAGVSEAQSGASSRLLDGFTVTDAVCEFRVLRASVLHHWRRVQGMALTPGCIELTRFNEAIDQALTESLAGFSDDKVRSARQPFAQHVRAAAQGVASGRGQLARGARVYGYLLAPVRDEHDQVEAVAGSARDITERKAAEEKYRRSAHYDNLTGLPNRYLFVDRLEQEIKRAGRLQLPLALLSIDLDRFKQVNDQLGHQAGDAVLRQGAARIARQMRGSESVARMGGDEFAALLTDIRNLPHVDILARHIVAQLALPFALGIRPARIGCSIGIALYPRDATCAEELLRHADQAMHAVKKDGGGGFAFFTPVVAA
jgi:diguanylate cyclase (GGDEF)-like protein